MLSNRVGHGLHHGLPHVLGNALAHSTEVENFDVMQIHGSSVHVYTALK